MSRIEQWIAFAIAVVTLGSSVVAVNYWYLSNAVPTLITTELDKRALEADANKPDDIVAALAVLSDRVEGLTTETKDLRDDIQDNFKWLSDKIMEL